MFMGSVGEGADKKKKKKKKKKRRNAYIFEDIFVVKLLQSNLVISDSLISNYRLSRSENLVSVLT